jgi:guanylate kinase
MDRIPALHRRTKDLREASLRGGVIESFTTIHHPPAGFGSEPYTVALIAREDGTKVMAQLTRDGMMPTIGAQVMPRMRRIRTMQNGLFVNDLKYEVVEKKVAPLFTMHAYVLAITGPAGVGKTTITKSLLSLASPVAEQVAMVTTYKGKRGEGEPRISVSEEKFEAMVASGEIIAHTVFSDRREYRVGYRKQEFEAIWKRMKLPIVTTDVRLLEDLSKALGREVILSCGLLPPGTSRRRMLSVLLHRLRSRGSDTEQQIEQQMKSAEDHLKAFDSHAHLFDHLVVNDELEACVESIRELVVPGN